MNHEAINGTSTAAVQKATGKHWDEWIIILDDANMQHEPHASIAAWLWENYGDEKGVLERNISGWWCQQVTVGYEYALGRRILGQTADTGFQVGIQKTLPLDVKDLWNFVTGPGVDLWLGQPLEFSLKAKTPFKTVLYSGEIRSVDLQKRIRLAIEGLTKEKSTLQLYFTPKNNKTTLGFHHEKLQDAAEREHMQKHWSSILGVLQDTLTLRKKR